MRLYKEEKNIVYNRFKGYKKILQLLGERWIEDNLFKPLSRARVHPLMWILLDEIKGEAFLDGLRRLIQKKYPKLSSLIKAVKKSSYDDLSSLFSEIQIFQHLDSLKAVSNCTFRPAKGDIEFVFVGKKVSIEVFTLFQDEKERNMEKYEQKLEVKFNRLLVSKGIHIIPHYERYLDEGITDYIYKEVKKFIRTETDIAQKKMEIKGANGQILVKIDFQLKTTGKSYIPGIRPVGQPYNFDRIKTRLLDKFKKFQFSPDADLRGFVIHFTSAFDYIELRDALLGQYERKYNPITGRTYRSKKSNGVIHDKNLGKAFTERIDFVVGYFRSRLETRDIILNEDKITDLKGFEKLWPSISDMGHRLSTIA